MPPLQRPINDADAIAWLVEQVPELRGLLDEHVAYYEELLPYVIFEGDFLRWFVHRVRAGDHEPARRFVAAIEPLMASEIKDPVWNLAGVCFVEGLVMQGTADDVIAAARPWMGPNTARDFDAMFRYRDTG